MKLYRGIGQDGQAVVFLQHEGTLASTIAKFAGGAMGVPALDTIAHPIADVIMKLEPIVDGQPVKLTMPPPEMPNIPSGILKSIKAHNQSMLSRKPRLYIHKAEEGEDEQGLATMIAMEPNDGDGVPVNPDTQNDVFSKAEVADASYFWLENGGAIDFMHSFDPIDRDIVKVAASGPTYSKVTLGEGDGSYECAVGTWLVTLRFDTESTFWLGLKDGTFSALSPGGLAQRVPFEAEA